MNEEEIMRCAAILTAGLLAGSRQDIATAADAVNLCKEVAETIRSQQEVSNREHEVWL